MQHSDAQNSLDSVKNDSSEQATNKQRSQVAGRGSGKKKRSESKLRQSTSSLLSQKLKSLRDTLQAQGHLSELPAEFAGETMPDSFFDVFQTESLSREPDDSIQHALAYVLRKTSSGKKIDQVYKEARKSSLMVLFDCSVKAHFEKSCLESDSLAAAHFRSLILLDPQNILENASVAKYLADEMEKHRSQFLKSLSKDFYNADRRRQRVPVDVCSYILARYWTDKHCPLWLMGTGAMLKACKSLAPQESWTEAVVRERIKKHRLRGFRPAPITGVRLGKGDQVAAFELVGGTCGELGMTNFGCDFAPTQPGGFRLDFAPTQLGGFRLDARSLEHFSEFNRAKRNEAFYAGAPRGYKDLRDRVHDLQKRADNILDRISRMDLPHNDPRFNHGLNEVAALNKVATVVAASANVVKFRSGWVEPHFTTRYQATEAKSPAKR